MLPLEGGAFTPHKERVVQVTRTESSIQPIQGPKPAGLKTEKKCFNQQACSGYPEQALFISANILLIRNQGEEILKRYFRLLNQWANI